MKSGRSMRALSAIFVLALGSFVLPSSSGNQLAMLSNAAREYFTDTVLVDQDAQPHRFYSDLIAGRTVVINLIFTGCRSSCPIIMGRLVELQDLLGAHPDTLSILSISVDPVIDTPQALHAYAEGLQARPGWYFLTGAQGAIDTIARRLGNRSSKPEDHNDVIVVGNDESGTWIKLTAIATTEDIAQAVAEVGRKPRK